MREAIDLIKSGSVRAILINGSTQTAQIESLLSVNTKIPNYEFSELLSQDPDTLEYFGGYFAMLDGAIEMVIGK
jgi:hypothetical protein